jgi:hypothetical protein
MTRKEYMQNPGEFHQGYFLQFATPTIRMQVARMKWRIAASTDPHFNDIPLRIWDDISRFAFHELCNVNLKINGTCSASLSDGVCAAKAYARTLK